MSDETYNGWSNRETWAIKLHMDNNEGDYRYWQERTEEIVSECKDDHEEWNTPREEATWKLAESVKEWTEEVFSSVTDPEYPPTHDARMFVSDVGSWWRADFHEIAENMLSEWCEDEEES